MKITKIAKILPIALAFTVCGAFANGADESTSAKVDYSLKLNDYIKITVDKNSKQSETTFGEDYGDITISSALSSTFTVISNAETRKLLLKGTCQNTGSETGIKYVDDTHFNLVFTNKDHQPDAASVQNIKGTPAMDSNPNAIAFAVTLAPTRTQGPNTSKPIKSTEYDDTNDGIAYTVENGHLVLAYTVDTKNVANTFNTQDMDGTYTATLTLTDLTSP